MIERIRKKYEGFGEHVHEEGRQVHGADVDAACAADAGGILAGGGQILLAQAEHAVAGLPHGDGQIILGKAHHRAAGDHPGGGPVKAAGLLNPVRRGCPQAPTG